MHTGIHAVPWEKMYRCVQYSCTCMLVSMRIPNLVDSSSACLYSRIFYILIIKWNYFFLIFDFGFTHRDINQLVLENIFGFILNIPADFTIGRIHLPLHRKHWIAVRQIGSIFYNLDSKLDAPEAIGAEGALRKFLTEQVESKEKQMLLVVNPAVAHSGAWINSGEKSTPTDAKDEKNDLSESMSGHGGS